MDDTGQGPNLAMLTVFWLAGAYSMCNPRKESWTSIRSPNPKDL